MRIGFTGTWHGMTDAQRVSFTTLRQVVLADDLAPFHHGACKGADADAASLVRRIHPGARIIAHPGRSARGGSNELLDEGALADADERREAKTHFARNRDIVDETHVLIGCPGTTAWQATGGTFYTINYAIRLGKPVYIIWPDGRVELRTGAG